MGRDGPSLGDVGPLERVSPSQATDSQRSSVASLLDERLLAGLLLVMCAGDWAAADVAAVHGVLGLLTIPLLLWVPGHLLRKRLAMPVTSALTAFVLELAFGVAILILVGLILDRLPVGLTGTSWRISLVSVVTAELSWPGPRPLVRPISLKGRRVRIGVVSLYVIAALLSVGAYLGSRSGAIAVANNTPFTQLWALPRASDVTIGIMNHQGRATSYRLVVVSGGRTVTTYALRLSEGIQWETQLLGSLGVKPGARISVTLSLGTDTREYREVEVTWPTPPRS